MTDDAPRRVSQGRKVFWMLVAVFLMLVLGVWAMVAPRVRRAVAMGRLIDNRWYLVFSDQPTPQEREILRGGESFARFRMLLFMEPAIAGCRMDGKRLDEVADDLGMLRTLTELSFDHEELDGADIRWCRERFPELSTLCLTGCDCSEDVFAEIAETSTLQHLSIEAMRLNEGDLSALANALGLSKLTFNQCEFTDSEIEALGRLGKFDEIAYTTGNSDRPAAIAAALGNMRCSKLHLGLRHDEMRYRVLQEDFQCETRELTLDWLRDRDVPLLLERFPKLETLQLFVRYELSEDAIRRLEAAVPTVQILRGS